MGLLDGNTRLWFGRRKTPLPTGTKRPYFIGGAIGLAIWPGLGLVLLAIGLMEPGEWWFLLVSPWVFLTGLGLSMILAAARMPERRPRPVKQKGDR